MADATFQKAWLIMKGRDNPYKTRYPHKPSANMENDIDAAVDNVMSQKTPQKPPKDYSKPAITGFKTSSKDAPTKDEPLPPSIQNLLDRARGVPRKKEGEQKRPKKSETSELPTQTLQNLHRKVRGDE
jgi:hypothetical protein